MSQECRRVAFAAALLGAAALCLPAALPAQQPGSPYVVHEWGTFTSMVGQGGVILEGLHHEEEALPRFVHDLLRIEEVERTTGTKMPSSRVTQKMETPVIYFYTDVPMQAQVEVWLIQGLMTQFYPLPDLVMPEVGSLRQARVDMSKVDLSSLTWRVELIPHSSPPPAGIPAVPADDPWAFARQTGAAYVRTVPQHERCRAEAEHYLFYRGLGRWNPQVELRAGRGGKARFENGIGQRIPFTLALQLDAAGGRFARGPALEPGAGHDFDLGRAAVEKDRERFARRVGAEVLQALTEAGLYVDEARAMVATWSRSWFQSQGSRVIYFLPRAQIDAMLPMHLRPEPKELVRVMVGRHEFITPEAQDRVEEALRRRGALDPQERLQAEQVLMALDRFLEPHLRNVLAHGSSEAARAEAKAVLAAMDR